MGVPFAFGTTFFGGGLTYRFQIFTSDMEEMMQNEEYLFPVCGQKIRTRTHSLFFCFSLVRWCDSVFSVDFGEKTSKDMQRQPPFPSYPWIIYLGSLKTKLCPLVGSRESSIWIILTTILCLVLDFQGIHWITMFNHFNVKPLKWLNTVIQCKVIFVWLTLALWPRVLSFWGSWVKRCFEDIIGCRYHFSKVPSTKICELCVSL